MTAEARAQAIIDHFEAIQPYRRVLTIFISKAITEAIAEERERGEKIADIKLKDLTQKEDRQNEMSFIRGFEEAAERIAAAIRKVKP